MHNHFCKTIFILILSIGFSINAFAQTALIPQAGIAIDGERRDWDTIPPVYIDAAGDKNPEADFPGTDINTVHLAKDHTYLYIMMTLNDGAPGQVNHSLYVAEFTQSSTTVHTTGDRYSHPHISDGQWSLDVIERDGDETLPIAHYGADYIALGDNFIEWRVPLADMGEIEGRYLRAYTHVIEDPLSKVSDHNLTGIKLVLNEELAEAPLKTQTDFKINYKHFQYRVYKDNPAGKFAGWVDVTIQGEPVTESDIERVELLNPAGTIINSGAHFWLDSYYWGFWDDALGMVIFDGPFRTSGYGISFNEGASMPTGTYTYRVTSSLGKIASAEVFFPGKTYLPIPENLNYQILADGSLSLSWQNNPGDYDQLRVVLLNEKDWSDLIYIKLPVDKTQITIPSDIMKNIEPLRTSGNIIFRVQTRAIDADGHNYARGYSEDLVITYPGTNITYDLLEYLPLSTGSYWIYDCQEDNNGWQWQEKTMIGDQEIINNVSAVKREYYDSDYMNMTAINDYDLFSHDDEYIYIHGENQVRDTQWNDYPLGLTVYHPPITLKRHMKIGEIYSSLSTATDPAGVSSELSLKTTLLGIEHVSVPAGNFPNCLKIQIEFSDSHETEIEHLWWAKGVGEVKFFYPADNETSVLTAYAVESAYQEPEPLAVFISQDTTSGPIPLDILFNASATGGSENYTFTWNFGDTTTGTGKTVSHTYENGGNHKATVTVLDADGNTASDSVNIFVISLISMEISPREILLTQPGAAQRLLVKGFLNTGSPITPSEIKWITSDPGVILMDGDQVVAVSEGEATITATSGTVTVQARVKVNFLPVALDVSSALVLLDQGQVYTPVIFALYPDGTRKELTEFTLSFKDSASEGSKTIQITDQTLTGLNPGRAVLEVTYGKLSAEFLVNVSTPVPLNISPSRFRVNPGAILKVSINGGTPPYSSTIGFISRNLLTLTAPSEDGTHVYSVADSKGQSAQLNLTVLTPLKILSSSGGNISAITLDMGSSVALTASGGTPPYAWFATAGIMTDQNGSNTVTYTPPVLSGTNTVTVTDNGGQAIDVTISTVCTLTTTPQRLYMTPEESRTIEILGGLLPYTAVADAGSISQPLGGSLAYTAPKVTGDYLVKITDARGRTSRVQITVSLPLIVSPQQTFLKKNETRTFKLAGGTGSDKDIFITAHKGEVDAHPNGDSFNYTAPGVTGSDTLVITDAGGDQAKVSVEVTSDNFFVTPLQATLLREETRTFRIVGGTGNEIVWTTEQGDITGQNQPSIDYQAPNLLSTLALSAMDMEKREANSEIHVISDQVKISPARVYLKAGEKARFRGLFGTESYEFAWTQGRGEVKDGVLTYTAPSKTGIHYITLFDSAGNIAKAEAVISGGTIKKQITQTRVFTITAPDISPDSEAQPVAVGNVQQGGTTFSLA